MTDQYRTDEPRKDLGTQGHEDTLKGKMKEAAGKVQGTVGHVTGDKEMEAKGKAKEFEGKTQSTLGKGERKLDHALDPDRDNPNI